MKKKMKKKKEKKKKKVAIFGDIVKLKAKQSIEQTIQDKIKWNL